MTTSPRRIPKRKPVRFVPFKRGHGIGEFWIQLPIRIVSEANAREHWAAKHRRSSGQRATLKQAIGYFARELKSCRYRVELTRIGPRTLDGDNLQRSLKAIRDEVAAWAGIDDGDARMEWHYEQERSPAYGVRVRVVAR